MEAVFLTFVFVLSIFLGFELISKVPSTLHTPLMSGSNAISGITMIYRCRYSRDSGGNLCHYKCGRRLRGDKQDAGDVQEKG
jgi:hypothetical protein